MGETSEVIDQLTNYGEIIAAGLPFLLTGMLVVLLLHKLATKFLYPYLKSRRLVAVIFGMLYVLVLVITVLLLLKRLGYDTSGLGQIALLAVLVGAVLAFFLAPYLPSLPFVIGNMVEIGGITGIVDTITPFHTHLRTFDGRMVFIPNAVVMASRIVNFHFTPTRRVDLELSVATDSDLTRARDLLLRLMAEQEQVLGEPAPSVLVMDANAARVQMTGYCWVENAAWASTRSELWLKIMEAFRSDETVSLSLEKQEVVVSREGPV